MQLKTLLKRPAITAEHGMPLAAARDVMRRHGVRHLPVVRERALVGMLTDRDLQRVAPSSVGAIRAHDVHKLLASLTVADAMTREAVAVPADTSVAQAALLARSRRVDALVVMDGGEVTGVVTRSDLLAVLRGALEHSQPTGLGHILAATSLRPGRGRTLAEAVRLAEATGAQLTVVVGNTEPRGPFAAVETTVAAQLVRCALCPVLAVPPRPEPDPVSRW